MDPAQPVKHHRFHGALEAAVSSIGPGDTSGVGGRVCGDLEFSFWRQKSLDDHGGSPLGWL
jgi:hypothetical protein